MGVGGKAGAGAGKGGSPQLRDRTDGGGSRIEVKPNQIHIGAAAGGMKITLCSKMIDFPGKAEAGLMDAATI